MRATLVLALAAAIAIGVFGTSLATPADQGSDAAAGGSYASTPRAEWVQGSIPFLYQTDPAWAEAPYAGGTVKENGCGPTCLSMAYIALAGKTDLDPAAMAQFSERQGYVEGDMTSWSLMTQGAAEPSALRVSRWQPRPTKAPSQEALPPGQADRSASLNPMPHTVSM